MATSKRYPLVRYNHTDMMMIVRTDKDEDNLDFLNFIETDNGIFHEDSSGHKVPLNKVLIESPEGLSGLESVIKTRLAEKMCKVLGETSKYYIIRKEE